MKTLLARGVRSTFSQRGHIDRVAKESRNVNLRPDLLLLSHLQLADPGAVPVRKASPLYEELPLWVALERRLGQWIVWLAVRARRQFSWQRGFSPRPVQNLLDLAFEGRALRKKKKRRGAVLHLNLVSKQQCSKSL